jgi:hypothetical protein
MRSSALAVPLLALAALGACDDERGRPAGVAAAATLPTTAPAFRWLPGLAATAIATERSAEAADQLAAWAPDEPCPTWDARAIVADVAPAGGAETVLASVASGVVVLDADQRLLSTAPLADCGGSADGVIALAAGDAWIGAPVIAVVFSSGGRREADTSLALFRAGRERLEPIFTGVLEMREDDVVSAGSAVLLPGAIVYRPPTGALEVHPL